MQGVAAAGPIGCGPAAAPVRGLPYQDRVSPHSTQVFTAPVERYFKDRGSLNVTGPPNGGRMRQVTRTRFGSDFLRACALCGTLASAPFCGAHAQPRATDSSWIKGLDTGWKSPFGSPGTGMQLSPGIGGSSRDSSLWGNDSLWSSPYNAPGTPGTGMPNSPGSGMSPGGSGTGSPGTKGQGGSGMGGSGIPADSSHRKPAAPPQDSIGQFEWMERG